MGSQKIKGALHEKCVLQYEEDLKRYGKNTEKNDQE